ncbi:MAG: acyl-CoA synthetase [delta proteobacterium ML8_F1]|nr:MAG: acyl-CoA synthetase [delta proteobacterium ML8_F1]
MENTITLYELAKVLRSKNSGPFEITFDIIFDSKEKYELVKSSGVITKELIQELYLVEEEDISHLVFYDPAYAIKITMTRSVDSGSIGDMDVYGSQQHAPLIDIKIPIANKIFEGGRK